MKTIGNILASAVVAIGIGLPTQAAEPSASSAWRAGTAKAKITPEQPFWLGGYASRTKPAEGKLHDLWVKVLAIEDAQHQKAVVVTTDLLGFPKTVADSICDQVQKQFGLSRSQIMLTSSHTHSGPVLSNSLSTVYTMDDRQCELRDRYTGELEQTIAKTVGEAIHSLTAAALSVGMGTCDFAVNRRNNMEKEVPKVLEEHKSPKGPVDHAVPVLAVRTSDGRLLATLFLYACHNTTLDINQYSGDYAGFAQIALEAAHPDSLAMFAIGCGADQNPLPRRSVELCQKYGDQLAGSVEVVLAGRMEPVEPSLHTEFAIADLPFDGELDLGQLRADLSKKDHQGRYAKQTLDRIAELEARGQQLPKSYPYPVQVWRLGDHQYWISLGGEVVVDYSLSFKEKYGQNTWVFGYANDVMSYIPSSRIWKEGGYESGAFSVYGLAAARWCPDIESRIAAAVEQLTRQAGQSQQDAATPKSP